MVLTPGSHYDAYTPPFSFLRQEGKRHSSSGQNNLAWSLYPGEIGLPPASLWGLHESNCRAFFAKEQGYGVRFVGTTAVKHQRELDESSSAKSESKGSMGDIL